MKSRTLIPIIMILFIASYTFALDDNYEKAKAAYAKKDWRSLVYYSEKLIDDYPEWFIAHYLNGTANNRLKHTASGVESFSTALKYAEDDEQKFMASYGMAEAYYIGENYSKAKEWALKCKALSQTKAYEKAASEVEKMISGANYVTTTPPENAPVFDGFRGCNWGDSREIVIQKEGDTYKTGDNTLIYADKILNMNTSIHYEFIDNKLAASGYIFLEEHVNKNDYINDYREILNVIKEKYGDPFEDRTIWKNDLYKDDFQEWGLAVSAGHMRMQSRWILKDTLITLLLYGDNFDVHLGVKYESSDLKEGLEHKDLEEAKKVF